MKSVINIIKDIQDKRKTLNVVPVHAILTDIISEVVAEAMEDLREAVKNGSLEYHETINGHAFSTRKNL